MENAINGTFNETNYFDRFSFGWVDYTIFSLTIICSLMIGVYFGFFTKQDTMIEYFLAGKRMKSLPIALSISASNLSGVALLGIPTEVFSYGSQHAVVIFSAIISAVFTTCLFLPVFHKLQVTSMFEYLELRFARPIRIFASLVYTISLFAYIPVVVYVPALVFTQVTSFSLYAIAPIICITCIIYTALGGLKAVVWSDVLQIAITVTGLTTVLVLGIVSVGGLRETWRIDGEGGRLVFFNMNPSPFERNSFWITTFGITGTWLGHFAATPGQIQRFQALPTKKDAIRGIITSSVALLAVQLICVITGLVIYAKYHDCDPILAKIIKRPDQILPYYVMDVAGHLQGLPGLFLAYIVSSGLAIMSTNLNTMSGTIYEDFVRPLLTDEMRKRKKIDTNIMKIISVICGVLAVVLVFLLDKLGTIFELGVSMHAVSHGPMLGIFTLGILVPWANAKGAMAGGCVALITMIWMVVNMQWNIVQGKLKYPPLPTSTEACPYPLNETISTTMMTPEAGPDDEPTAPISFMYFATIGALIVLVVGTVTSFFFGVDLEQVNPDHIAPSMRRFLPPRKYTEVSLRETQPFDKSERSL